MSRPWTKKPIASRTSAGLALLVVAGLGGAAYALSGGSPQPVQPDPPARSSAGKASRWLSIRATPATREIEPGDQAIFAVSIHRGRGKGPRVRLRRVRFNLGDRLPEGASASFSPNAPRSSWVALTIRTTEDTPGGGYRLRVIASVAKRRAQAAVNLVVTDSPETDHSFGIAGHLRELLKPGLTLPLDLRITNPNSSALAVQSLGVTIAGVTAPHADADHPCTTADFSAEQFSGRYGFEVPASGTSSLSELGFPEDQLPQITMLNRPVNQDGCKEATLHFDFAGTGGGG